MKLIKMLLEEDENLRPDFNFLYDYVIQNKEIIALDKLGE